MYELKTTFWTDFSIADMFGVKAVRDTFERAFEEWKTDYKYLTELVMVLNWKIWEHWEAGREDLAEVYNELWESTYYYGLKTLKGEQFDYFYWTLD